MRTHPPSSLRTTAVLATAGRVAAALAITAFIGWYAIDMAATRGSTTVEFAAWIWVATLGWLVVVLGVLGLSGDLGDGWHMPRAVERRGAIYRALRVSTAKRFMPNGDYAVRALRHVRPGYRLVRDRASAAKWERHTRSKEGGHVLHLVTTLPLLMLLIAQRALVPAVVVLALDVVFDLYPVFVQRYNRVRITRLLARAPMDVDR